MIIVKLMGGLGNQMFQYAAGRRLSIKHNTPIKLDLSYLSREWLERLKGNPVRKYSLYVLNIQAELANRSEIPPLSWAPGTRLAGLINQLNKYIHPQARLIIRELPHQHEENLSNLAKAPKEVYLDGFWQSEAYFKEISQIIYREFTFKQKLDEDNQRLAVKIHQSSSISIHVRRQDYVHHPVHSRFFQACSPDYYHACVKLIKQQVPNPHFFIFGDDLAWARENLEIDDPTTFVEHNYQTWHYFEDIRLMSFCKHNIIANSAFSWWGAWLNQNKNKLVLAPKKWFKTAINDQGLISADWIRV